MKAKRHMLTLAFSADEVRYSTTSVDSLFSRLCPNLAKCHVRIFWWKVQCPERCTVQRKVENEKRSWRTPSIYFMTVGQELQKGKPMRPHTDANSECIASKYPYNVTFPRWKTDYWHIGSVCVWQRLWLLASIGWITWQLQFDSTWQSLWQMFIPFIPNTSQYPFPIP